MLTKEQIKRFKDFGIGIEHLTESEATDELLKRVHLLALSSEFTDKEYLRREILRVLKPNN